MVFIGEQGVLIHTNSIKTEEEDLQSVKSSAKCIQGRN